MKVEKYRAQAETFFQWLEKTDVVLPEQECAEPLFSIIIPVHNRVDCIAGGIKSIQLQSFTEFEIIIIDDASTDATATVVEKIQQNDPRIKLIRLEKNVGPGPARNIGIAQARGKYIRICDSDDFYPPDALAAFVRQIDKGEDDLIAGGLSCLYGHSGELRPRPGPWQIHRRIQTGDLRQLPELWAMVHFHRCAFRREFLLENSIEYPALRRGEDPIYVAKVLTCATSFALFPDPAYVFYERPRQQEFVYEHIRDATACHQHIRRIMTDAGYEDLACFFDCFYPPFSQSHARLTKEESLRIAEQLADFSRTFPAEVLDHPYLEDSECDKVALQHDLLVAQNLPAEMLAGLARRRMFGGQIHMRKAELHQLHMKARSLRQQLRPFRFPLRIARAVKQRLPWGATT